MRYTVRFGETLSAIAARHQLDMDELLRINRAIVDPERIFPGQSIYLPRRGTGDALARWRGAPPELEAHPAGGPLRWEGAGLPEGEAPAFGGGPG